MEWLVLTVSLLGAAVSVVGAVRSQQAAQRATQAERRRETGRTAIASVMELGNTILQEQMSGDPGTEASQEAKWVEFNRLADEAVTVADAAQLPRFHAPLTGASRAARLRERLDRLQEIQDRL